MSNGNDPYASIGARIVGGGAIRGSQYDTAQQKAQADITQSGASAAQSSASAKRTEALTPYEVEKAETENRLAKLNLEKAEAEKAERLRQASLIKEAEQDVLDELTRSIAAAAAAKKKSRSEFFATGFGSPIAATIGATFGGTEAKNVAGLVETVGNLQAVNRLAELKKAGIALTPVSNTDIDLLKNSVANLSQAQTDAEFQRSMDVVMRNRLRIFKKLNGSPSLISQEYESRTGESLPEGLIPGIDRIKEPQEPGWRQSPLNIPTLTERAKTPEGLVVFDEEKTAILQDAFDRGASKSQMEALSKELFGSKTVLPDVDAAIRYRQDFIRSGGTGPSGVQIMPRQRPMTEEEKKRVSTLESPERAFGASLGSGLTLGIAPLMLDEKSQANLQYMRETSPWASLAGEFAGSMTPGLGLGKGIGLGSEALMGAFGREGLSLPAQALAGDIVSSGITGATANPENPITGAILGASMGATGGVTGRYLGTPALTKPGEFLGVTPKVSLAESTLAKPNLFGREAEDFLSEAARLDVPAGLGDVRPELTGRVARVSKEGADTAEVYAERQKGAPDRAISAIERDVAPEANLRELENSFEFQANMAAEPYYDIVRAKPAPVDPALDQMLGSSLGQKGLKRAFEAAEAEGRDPRSMGFDLDNLGNVIVVQKPSWDTLIHIRKGINDELNSYRDPITRILDLSKPEARNADRFLNRFTKRLDNLSEDYKAARAVYSQAIRPKDYLELGAKAPDTKLSDVELTLANIAKIPDEAQREAAMQAYRQAYSTRLINDIRNSKVADPYSVAIGTPAQRSKMRLIGLTPDNFLEQSNIEQRLAKTAHETKVGIRGERRVEGENVLTEGDIPTAVIETAVSGAPIATLLNIARRGIKNYTSDRRGLGVRATARAKQLAPDLMGTDPTEALQRLQEAQALSAARTSAIQIPEAISTLAGGLGVRAGIAASPQPYEEQYNPRAPNYMIGANIPPERIIVNPEAITVTGTRPQIVDEDEENFILSDGTKLPKSLAARPMPKAKGGKVSKRLACR